MKIDYQLSNISSKDSVQQYSFDAFIYAVGYEKRSSFVRSTGLQSSEFFALDYDCSGVGDYDTNLKEARQRQDTLVDFSGRDVFKKLTAQLRSNAGSERSARCIGVDVSCLDRSLMSFVILSLFEATFSDDQIVFFYTPAEFKEPTIYLSPLRKFAPAIPELSGSIGNPYKSRALIMGLGYEYGAALNVFNILEPEFAHLFYPIGDDVRFLPHVKKANFEFEFGVNNYKVSSYNFKDPVAVHGQIRDLVFSLRSTYTIMFVPFGPKLFSALGILICLNNQVDCSFMRYSVEPVKDMSKIESSGEIHGFVLTRT